MTETEPEAHTIVERELKFLLRTGAMARLARIPLLVGRRPTTHQMEATYFDTADGELRRAGYSLRLRRSGGRTIQTLKGGGGGGGLFARDETETELTGDVPLPALLRGALPDELLARVEDRLAPMFRVRIQRQEWQLPRYGATLMVQIDTGHVETGVRRDEIRELEIELVDGPLTALFEVAREIAATVPLQLGIISKSERGFRLLEGSTANAVRAEPPAIRRDMPTGDAFRTLAGQAIRHFADNSARFDPACGAEIVHQMRVALRRLRSLVSLERRLFVPEERATLTREVARTFRRLGKARDLDLLLETLAKLEEGEHRDALMGTVSAERQASYAGIGSLLGSKRLRIALIDLLAQIEAGPWISAEATRQKRWRERPAPDTAADILRQQWKKLDGFDRPSSLDVATRHKLRIRAKHFRYACDFFGTLYQGAKAEKRRTKMLSAVTKLQDALGELNDRASMGDLLRQRFPADPLIGDLLEQTRGDEEPLLEVADAAFKKLLDRKPFWE